MAVDELVRIAYRHAHWPRTQGAVECPRCHDGADLVPGTKPLLRHKALKVYRCAACDYSFSDLVGSPLEKTSLPLCYWAFVALGGEAWQINSDPARRQELAPALRLVRIKLLGHRFTELWCAQLGALGVTVEALIPLVQAYTGDTRRAT
jgi:hypothetical protein